MRWFVTSAEQPLSCAGDAIKTSGVLTLKDYFDLPSASPGNAGLYVGQPGDPRTYGVTLRFALK